MSAPVEEGVRSLPRRAPLSALSFNVATALSATVLAGVVLVAALAAGTWRPEPLLSITLFAAAPLCAAMALPVLVVRGRVENLPAVRWLGAGVAVSWVALTLQLISFPTISPGGGPLRTNGTSSVQLYLSAHAAIFGAALLGTMRTADRWRPRLVVLGVLVSIACAVNLVPAPILLTPDQTFTTPVLATQWLLTALGALAVWRWVAVSGPSPTPLIGWCGVALMLFTYEIALNALAGRRYSALWWSSLSLRVATFAALGFGCLFYVLRQLSRIERYTDAELVRSDTELSTRAAVIDQLLVHARRLATSRTPADVARILADTAQQISEADAALVSHLVEHPPAVVRLAAAGGWLRPSGEALTPSGSWRSGDPPLFLTDRGRIQALLAGREGGAEVAALAVLPLRVRDLVVGVLEVAHRQPRTWTTAEQELLQGLADQAGPALSRARLAERESEAAQTLQRSLLPRELPHVPEATLAAVYRPAELGTHVGGDWYDVWTLPDRRVALAIGDVNGKGMVAAATSGRLRAAMRALAATDPSPATVLRRLDDLESREGLAMIATVTYAVLDPATGQVHLARAGHTPTLLVHPGRTTRVLEPDGSAIGLAAGPFAEQSLRLVPGDVLVMYTDGLIERRTLTPDEQLDRLIEALALVGPEDTEHLPDALMNHFRPLDDDVAVLVAGIERVHR